MHQRISGQLAVTIGIVAGFAALVGVVAATGQIDRSDVAILAACFATVTASLVPMLSQRRGRACPARSSSPRRP